MKKYRRRNLLFFASIAAILLSGFYPVGAEDKEAAKLALLGEGLVAPPLPAGMATKVSLDLRNIDVVEALKFLSMKSGMNIVPTQKVSGKVTLRVENVPVVDIFDIMLRSNSLAYDMKGDIYNVMSEAEYKALYGRNFSDTRQVKVFRLQYAGPEQAFSLLEALKSDIGRILVEPDSGTVMIMDTPGKIQEAEKALGSLEQKGVVKVLILRYARAKDMEEQLKGHLDMKKVGTVKADERNNQIIVQALPERMKDIESLVASLDKKTKEVLIDARVIQIRLSNQLDTGIQWEGLAGFLQREGMAYLGSYPFSAVQAATDAWRSRSKVFSDVNKNVGSYPFSGTTSNFSASTKVSPGNNLHVGMIMNNQDMDIIIKYLQTLGKTKIVSNPSLAVINNQEAKIHIGERRAYVTTTTSTGQDINTVSEQVNFVDVGIQLSVTPTINEEGYVVMKIKPEISTVTDFLTTTTGNVIPIVDTSMAETTVMAKDGATIMLAGLGREEKTESSEGIPFLSKIPILGFIFRSSTKAVVRNELLVLLTPHIFEGDSLITAKNIEKESHGIKKTKKFDVFQPDIQAEVHSDESGQQASVGKGLKAYQAETLSGAPADDSDKNIFAQEPDFEEANQQDAVQNKETVAPKGFKEYGSSMHDDRAVAVNEIVKEDIFIEPKGSRL